MNDEDIIQRFGLTAESKRIRLTEDQAIALLRVGEKESLAKTEPHFRIKDNLMIADYLQILQFVRRHSPRKCSNVLAEELQQISAWAAKLTTNYYAEDIVKYIQKWLMPKAKFEALKRPKIVQRAASPSSEQKLSGTDPTTFKIEHFNHPDLLNHFMLHESARRYAMKWRWELSRALLGIRDSPIYKLFVEQKTLAVIHAWNEIKHIREFQESYVLNTGKITFYQAPGEASVLIFSDLQQLQKFKEMNPQDVDPLVFAETIEFLANLIMNCSTRFAKLPATEKSYRERLKGWSFVGGV